uniref:DUF19 domain-containing protein n=1 Tax=Romanomermis culicivorax TaxID=13658 RepID=A0A915I4M2_ROMCU
MNTNHVLTSTAFHSRLSAHCENYTVPYILVPQAIRSKLASQNCSEKVQHQLQLCAAKANLTSENRSPDQPVNQSSTSTFNPASILFKVHSSSSTDNKLISLNRTCKSYDFYRSCVDDVFRDAAVRKGDADSQGRHCYSYVDDVLSTLMGFFCQPSRRSLLIKNHRCLSEILKKETTKNCLNVFEQSSRMVRKSSSDGKSNADSSSKNSDPQMEFGNLCYAIRYFGDCLGPAVAKNCSADLDFTIRQYVNESLSVIFGGTCEQVTLESEAGEEFGSGANAVGSYEHHVATKNDSRRAINEGSSVSPCRDDVDFMNGISACWKKFTDSSAADLFFKSSRNDSEFSTLTVEQIDNLEEMCALFQSFEQCCDNLSKSKPLCDSSLILANVKSAVEPYCQPPSSVASWKRYGPCLVDALDAPSARKCRKGRGSSCTDEQTTADLVICAKNAVNSTCGSAAAEFYSKYSKRVHVCKVVLKGI